MYQLFIDIYIYVFFKAQVCESPSYCNHIYIIYIQIYIYICINYLLIYIYIHALHGFQSNYTVTVAEFQSPSGTSFRGG